MFLFFFVFFIFSFVFPFRILVVALNWLNVITYGLEAGFGLGPTAH